MIARDAANLSRHRAHLFLQSDTSVRPFTRARQGYAPRVRTSAKCAFMRNLFRILIIADAGLVRDGLSSLLDLKDYAEVVGAGASVAALDQLCLDGDPHLVIVDDAALDPRWSAGIASIKSRWPAAKVIVLTFGNQWPSSATEHELSGANARFPKTQSGRQFVEVVRAVLEAERHQAGLPATPHLHAKSEANPDGLSDREREVMKQIARGLRTRQIAVQLSVSEKTIEKHRSNLMRKLGLRTATAVAAYAIANGYVERP